MADKQEFTVLHQILHGLNTTHMCDRNSYEDIHLEKDNLKFSVYMIINSVQCTVVDITALTTGISFNSGNLCDLKMRNIAQELCGETSRKLRMT